MKILRVCKGNNCRSQVAEAIYNRLTNSADAGSAGIRVDGLGETLNEFSQRPKVVSFTLDVTRDAGCDIDYKPQV